MIPDNRHPILKTAYERGFQDRLNGVKDEIGLEDLFTDEVPPSDVIDAYRNGQVGATIYTEVGPDFIKGIRL